MYQIIPNMEEAVDWAFKHLSLIRNRQSYRQRGPRPNVESRHNFWDTFKPKFEAIFGWIIDEAQKKKISSQNFEAVFGELLVRTKKRKKKRTSPNFEIVSRANLDARPTIYGIT